MTLDSPLTPTTVVKMATISQTTYLNEWEVLHIALNLVLKCPIHNKPALVQSNCLVPTGEMPLSEPMLNQFIDAYMRHQGNYIFGWMLSSYFTVCVTVLYINLSLSPLAGEWSLTQPNYSFSLGVEKVVHQRRWIQFLSFQRYNNSFPQIHHQNPAHLCISYVWLSRDAKCFWKLCQ